MQETDPMKPEAKPTEEPNLELVSESKPTEQPAKPQLVVLTSEMTPSASATLEGECS